MSNTVTFTTIDGILRRLGFTAIPVPGSHTRYEHPPSSTVLVLREYRPAEPVSWSDLTVVRRFLVERGFMDAEAFERLLHEPAA
jgi:predicted RNA binding protein YcfA (HicA-like mRNA interferase family)